MQLQSVNASHCDSWIDDFIEFIETALPAEASQMSIAEVFYKFEASKAFQV